MLNPRLARRYAKSLVDLASEKNALEAVYQDMLFIQSICKQSREFVTLLKSPVVKGDKKEKIIHSITEKAGINEITRQFISLLIRKGREYEFPEIVTAFIAQYKAIKEIYEVQLTTAVPVSEELKQSIISKIKASTPMQNIDLKTVVDESLIGGFVLEMGDKLVDASISRDLRDISKQFSSNDYIYNIR
ncbi:MAG TPA: ATP synthase F1 subunit delta [Parasegetibacter sp.]